MGTTSRKGVTLKIIISYAVLGILGLLAAFYIYGEVKPYMLSDAQVDNDQKLLLTNSLLSQIYETESLLKGVQQRNGQEHFYEYSEKLSALKLAMDSLKTNASSEPQVQLLDSIALLLQQKANNSQQLAKIRERQTRENPLDSLMEGFQKIEQSLGKITPESLSPHFDQLSAETQKTIREYAAYLNENVPKDTGPGDSEKKMDSIIAASKALLQKAKKEHISFERGLAQKEMALFRTDLALSEKIGRMIFQIEKEVTTNSLENEALKQQALTKSIRLAGGTVILALIIVAIFTVLIKKDFFKMQQLKNRLEREKKFSDSLLKSREQLISTVSHDLRTPLNTIMGYTELIENTTDNNKRKSYLKSVRSASNYVERLVNDLLDYSQIEAGKIVLQKRAFNLTTLLQEIESEYRQLYEKKGLALVLECDTFFKRAILSDPTRLKQILSNLLGNALKFTETGSVTIRAIAQHKKLVISVIDTGIGIERKHLARIFDEFSQAGSKALQQSGYGLGLTISKKLAKLLNGDIRVKSEMGKGSTFSVSLPLIFADEPLTEQPENHPNSNTILLIDDDTAMTGLITEICSQNHLKTLVFNDFNQVPKEQHLSYDLVLTDIQMPAIDGFKVLTSLRSGHYQHYQGQAIIAMTGDRTKPYQNYTQAGFAEVLKKPFTAERLLQKIGLHISGCGGSKPRASATETIQKNTHDSVFNLSLIASFLDNDPRAMNRVLQTFLVDTRQNLNALRTAVEANQRGVASNIAHRMLPMFLQLQATSIIGPLESLEKTPEKGIDDWQQQWPIIEKHTNHLLRALEKHLDYTLSL